MGKLIDLTGQKFGRLTVIERAENDKKGNSRWLCQCDCGNTTVVRGYHIKNGRVRSCGCLLQEKRKQHSFTLKHGKKPRRLYDIWSGIKTRCFNPNRQNYKNYGGRGITVCPEWRDSYEAFRDWSLQNGYADNLSIDRIDNDGPYSPENCRWITLAEQARNKRNMHLIEYNGKTQCLADWAREMGIGYNILSRRLSRGWSLEDALTTPIDKPRH